MPLGLVIARGGEIEHQGFVEIVLHVADRDRRPFGDRFGERKGFRLQLVVGDHAVDEADRLASGGIDLLAVNINSRAREVPTSRVSSQAMP